METKPHITAFDGIKNRKMSKSSLEYGLPLYETVIGRDLLLLLELKRSDGECLTVTLGEKDSVVRWIEANGKPAIESLLATKRDNESIDYWQEVCEQYAKGSANWPLFGIPRWLGFDPQPYIDQRKAMNEQKEAERKAKAEQKAKEDAERYARKVAEAETEFLAGERICADYLETLFNNYEIELHPRTKGSLRSGKIGIIGKDSASVARGYKVPKGLWDAINQLHEAITAQST